MQPAGVDRERIRAAWEGRIAGCMLGKPVEVLSFREGLAGLRAYLERVGALPPRAYLPDPATGHHATGTPGHIGARRSLPDDDINYTVLALLLLEARGKEFETSDIARLWLRRLPAGATWTAERAAYRTLLANMDDEFVNGAEPGFDLALCAGSEHNEWIGAQIRADLYGWVCPGEPDQAADLARRDASFTHRGAGVDGAAFIAALGAAIPDGSSIEAAIDVALEQIPDDGSAANAVRFARSLAGDKDAVDRLHEHFRGMSPVHAVNNLALVTWALCSSEGDFAAAIGNAVAAGWDTDSNGATVGALSALSGARVAEHWNKPWSGRIGVDIGGMSELSIAEATSRTIAVAEKLQEQRKS